MSSVPPNKRKRDDEPTDTSTNPKIRTEDLTGFSWSRKVKEMDYAKLLQYIPSLPERTQYFDTGVLLGAVLDPGTYSAGFLSVWREVSMNVLCPGSLTDLRIRFEGPKSFFITSTTIHLTHLTGLRVYLRCMYTSKRMLFDTDE